MVLYQNHRANLVEVTGCGCPVDTSVQSTEAPTEAAAETLKPTTARLCFAKKSAGLRFSLIFWSTAPANLLPSSRTASGRSRDKLFARYPAGIGLVLPKVASSSPLASAKQKKSHTPNGVWDFFGCGGRT